MLWKEFKGLARIGKGRFLCSWKHIIGLQSQGNIKEHWFYIIWKMLWSWNILLSRKFRNINARMATGLLKVAKMGVAFSVVQQFWKLIDCVKIAQWSTDDCLHTGIWELTIKKRDLLDLVPGPELDLAEDIVNTSPVCWDNTRVPDPIKNKFFLVIQK